MPPQGVRTRQDQQVRNFADQVASLLESRLPLEVHSAGAEDDWEVDGPALLVAAARHLRAIDHLQRDFPSALVTWQLARSMYEYVTTYAWVAVDPGTRAHEWMVSDYKQRVKLRNDFEKLGQELLADEQDRARLDAVANSGPEMPRSLADRAEDADGHWQPKLDELGDRLTEDLRSFRGLYPLIYRGGSRFIHPSTHGVAAFVSGNPPDLEVSDERQLQHDLASLAAGILAAGLVVATEATPGLGISIEEIRGALS